MHTLVVLTGPETTNNENVQNLYTYAGDIVPHLSTDRTKGSSLVSFTSFQANPASTSSAPVTPQVMDLTTEVGVAKIV